MQSLQIRKDSPLEDFKMILNFELTSAELEELRSAMVAHIENIEMFNPGICDERFQAIMSLTEKFKEVLNEHDRATERE